MVLRVKTTWDSLHQLLLRKGGTAVGDLSTYLKQGIVVRQYGLFQIPWSVYSLLLSRLGFQTSMKKARPNVSWSCQIVYFQLVKQNWHDGFYLCRTFPDWPVIVRHTCEVVLKRFRFSNDISTLVSEERSMSLHQSKRAEWSCRFVERISFTFPVRPWLGPALKLELFSQPAPWRGFFLLANIYSGLCVNDRQSN